MKETICLTKSQYCRALQCSKMLWMDQNEPEDACLDAPEFIIANVEQVGELGCSYFGDYVIVDENENIEFRVRQTRILMESGEKNIANACFMVDGLFCVIDLLHKRAGGWDIIEIKRATHISDATLEELAFENYVLGRCHVRIKGVFGLHINNSYQFHEKLNIKELFTLEDCTFTCRQKFHEVKDNVRRIRKVLNEKEEPKREIGTYCQSPYACIYRNHCWKDVPEESIFNVKGIQADLKYEYYHEGIVTFEDVIEKQPELTENQVLQVETTYYNKPATIDRHAINEFLKTLTYPIYFLDFETYQTAVPEYEGTRPYHQIPFQYSLHIQQEDGKLEHREFLAKEGTDSRKELAKQLCEDIPRNVCGVAYSMEFEKFILKELADYVPELSEHLLNIRSNMHDLMLPFQKRYYYTEAMRGSHSIKNVLPALYPDDPSLDYSNLAQIQNGAQAASSYADIMNRSEEERKELRASLLEYCGLDTYAMVKILERLRKI